MADTASKSLKKLVETYQTVTEYLMRYATNHIIEFGTIPAFLPVWNIKGDIEKLKDLALRCGVTDCTEEKLLQQLENDLKYFTYVRMPGNNVVACFAVGGNGVSGYKGVIDLAPATATALALAQPTNNSEES